MQLLKTIKGFVLDLKNMAAIFQELYMNMPHTTHGQVFCYLKESRHIFLILETQQSASESTQWAGFCITKCEMQTKSIIIPTVGFCAINNCSHIFC